MSSTKFSKNISNLTLWIDKQKAFERHKKQLDGIYSQLNNRSQEYLGLKNETYNFMKSKIKTLELMHRFNATEKKRIIDKDDYFLQLKKDNIQNRKNFLVSNEATVESKLNKLKNRSELIKSLQEDEMRKLNTIWTKRLRKQGSFSPLNEKEISKDFRLKQTYMNFSKKFELPKISAMVPKIIGRRLDVSPYSRKVTTQTTWNKNQMSSSKTMPEDPIVESKL